MADLQQLLEKTSRTFALTIPLLPEPLRREITVAYLLFRIADTLEDAHRWNRAERIAALGRFAQLLRVPDDAAARALAGAWVRTPPIEHEGYLELLEETPAVLRCLGEFPAEAQRLVRSYTLRTVDGMARFVSRGDEHGALALHDLTDLRDYCYVVAGIVGEMLTELFVQGRPELAPFAAGLRERASRFGEGLQLVNILKDSASDAVEGRVFLPATVSRAAVFALAREDLEAAGEYTRDLERAGTATGIIAFNALPVRLARATLDRVEEQGAGAKLTRPEVLGIVEGLQQDILAVQNGCGPV